MTNNPDVHAFYAALGIDLPRWADLNAAARCFANPEAHSREDRNPSCSVQLVTGAWKCHGCGAKGGAYDAALIRGHTPASAMDLLVACRLAERRQPAYRRGRSAPARSSPAVAEPTDARRELAADETDVRRWAHDLDRDCGLIRRLILERGWGPQAIKAPGIGHDGERITIPIRNHRGELRGVLRHDPFGDLRPKMLAVKGTRLGLLPHPDRDRRPQIALVEGPPDLIAARSTGMAAIAVPSATAWRSEWGQLLSERHVTVVMDCDAPGRAAAAKIASDLAGVAASVTVADLDPERADGYDLSDRIREGHGAGRHRSGPRPIAWPIASLLEHLTVVSSRPPIPTTAQESHR